MSGAEDVPAPRGLPGPLPEGETLLWQGSPAPRAFARDVLHTRLVAFYFGGAGIVVAALHGSAGRPLGSIAISLGLMALACLAVLGLIHLYARLVARSTIYTITSRRTVLRIGVAWPITLNLPHAAVIGAGLKTRRDGTGDLPIALGGSGRIAYPILWPHARPWKIVRPEPMMRAVPDAAKVGAILARALGSGQLGRAASLKAASGPRPVGGAVPSQAA